VLLFVPPWATKLRCAPQATHRRRADKEYPAHSPASTLEKFQNEIAFTATAFLPTAEKILLAIRTLWVKKTQG
jgi:hypothetical protein